MNPAMLFFFVLSWPPRYVIVLLGFFWLHGPINPLKLFFYLWALITKIGQDMMIVLMGFFGFMDLE